MDLISGILNYPVAFLFVLTVVVFVHEFGHYMVARWCGVRVEVGHREVGGHVRSDIGRRRVCR